MLDILHFASEAANSSGGGVDLQWLYILIPALFGGYGISSIVSHFTKRSTDAGAQRLEGSRLGQDIMEKAMLRLDAEVATLRAREEERELERKKDKEELKRAVDMNNALIRYLTKFINYIKHHGGTVPLVDPEDEPYLEELSKFAKADNEPLQ